MINNNNLRNRENIQTGSSETNDDTLKNQMTTQTESSETSEIKEILWFILHFFVHLFSFQLTDEQKQYQDRSTKREPRRIFFVACLVVLELAFVMGGTIFGDYFIWPYVEEKAKGEVDPLDNSMIVETNLVAIGMAILLSAPFALLSFSYTAFSILCGIEGLLNERKIPNLNTIPRFHFENIARKISFVTFSTMGICVFNSAIVDASGALMSDKDSSVTKAIYEVASMVYFLEAALFLSPAIFKVSKAAINTTRHIGSNLYSLCCGNSSTYTSIEEKSSNTEGEIEYKVVTSGGEFRWNILKLWSNDSSDRLLDKCDKNYQSTDSDIFNPQF